MDRRLPNGILSVVIIQMKRKRLHLSASRIFISPPQFHYSAASA